ncbi:MAG: DEAD/DEAH box helicase [Polyangiaceae bacterium]
MAVLQPRAASRSQPRPPWKPRIGVDAVVEDWVSSGYVAPCMVADRSLPANPPSLRPIPDSLRPELAAALRGRGIVELWSHQTEAIEAAIAGQGAPPGTAGRHVVIATPTASGKSLCFHLPVLQALAEDPTASAIYLYPTKALARDQESGLRELVAEAGLAQEPGAGGRPGVAAIVYDGDTPGDARRAAREKSPIVLTNPDMLHAGILPHHAHWARTFRSLRYVVIDELHTYRGVFGSHVAHVLSRLKRVAAFHGASPTFLCATATIGNAREHAARLLGVDEAEVTLCDQSGAPRGERRFFLYNPPVVNAELGVRASYVKAAVRLAADLVRARVPTIVFGASRNTVETMLKYLRDAVGVTTGDGRVHRHRGVPPLYPAGEDAPRSDGAPRDSASIPVDAIMAYRGGYLPETRRKIERGLRAGEILCVVATNALELGIDIGDLDAVICAGYPGSIAGTWQRSAAPGGAAPRASPCSSPPAPASISTWRRTRSTCSTAPSSKRASTRTTPRSWCST